MLLLKELLKQWMTARSPVKINTLSFNEWMTATLSMTKTNTTSKEGASKKVRSCCQTLSVLYNS